MKKAVTLFVLVFLLITCVSAQELPSLRLKDDFGFKNQTHKTFFSKDIKSTKLQPKRKTVTSYYGAGYSFVIFTSAQMNEAYPVFDTRKGDFLSEINVYFGFAVAKALTVEIEPSLLFTNTDKTLRFTYNPQIYINGGYYTYVYPYHLSMLALLPVFNVRFFPFYTQTSFARLFFIGGGAGYGWIHESYDYVPSNDPSGYYGGGYGALGFNATTSQWAPILRIMAGFTGSGGQFGFGGEVRYNIIPLKQTDEFFVTRVSPNFNSVDLTLRFYFSL
jgi:hypothetical protein